MPCLYTFRYVTYTVRLWLTAQPMVDRIGGLSASRHGFSRGFSACFLPFLHFLRRKILNQFCKTAVATRCGTHRPIRVKRNNRHYTNILRKCAAFSHFSKEYYAKLVIFHRNPQHSCKIPGNITVNYQVMRMVLLQLFPATFNIFLQFSGTADLRFGKNVFGKQKINTPGLFFRGCCVLFCLLRHGSLNCDPAIARYHSSIMSSYFFAICSFDSFCPSGSSFC